jgi:hypothetical protein
MSGRFRVAYAIDRDISPSGDERDVPIDLLNNDVAGLRVDVEVVTPRDVDFIDHPQAAAKGSPRHVPLQSNARGGLLRRKGEFMEKFFRAWVPGTGFRYDPVGDMPGRIGKYAHVTQIGVEPKAEAILGGQCA